jgi:hypothetical protein
VVAAGAAEDAPDEAGVKRGAVVLNFGSADAAAAGIVGTWLLAVVAWFALSCACCLLLCSRARDASAAVRLADDALLEEEEAPEAAAAAPGLDLPLATEPDDESTSAPLTSNAGGVRRDLDIHARLEWGVVARCAGDTSVRSRRQSEKLARSTQR